MRNFIRFSVLIVTFWAVMSALVNAGFLGVKKSSESIAFRLHNPLDSAGIPGKPDSAHVFTYADNALTNAYAARSTTYPFSDISIDTTKNYGDTAYWFVDAIADIDGPGGNVQLAIDVVLWYKKLPTHTFASVQVISDSLNAGLDSAKQARSVWDADVVTEANRTITIPDNGITATKIADNAIGSTELASNAITSAEIQDGAITSSKFATGAITSTVLADDAITGAKIAPGSIGSSDFVAGAIDATVIGAGAIGTSEAPLLANLDATVSSRSSFNAASDSVLVDLSAFNGALDNDTTLVNFLRAGIGGDGGSDSTSIARWVWNTPHSNHTVTGTFGRYLDAPVSDLSSGGGLYSRQILLFDSSNAQVIPGCRVTVRNMTQTALIAAGATSSLGVVVFNLDPDSFLVISFAPGYLFDGSDTILVNGAGLDTIYGYRFDPGAPSSPELCRVYGWLFDASGAPESEAVVAAYLPSGVSRIDSGIVSPFQVTAASDSNGYFFLDLIPNGSLIPDDSKYEITISRSDGTILRERLTVPQQSNWMLTW
ncbi:MAG: hypothetical protein HRF51_04425 [bacterium]|jgi:hypothetical protein